MSKTPANRPLSCAQAEALAAAAWGGDRCYFLVNGSTSGIHSLLLALAGPGDGVILPRNAHKSVQAALIFSGAVPLLRRARRSTRSGAFP